MLAVNDAALRHYGYTREEFMALRVEDIWIGMMSRLSGAHFAPQKLPCDGPGCTRSAAATRSWSR